jgi:serine/threonine protein kinase/tetratricopeptide (TPR) repeat protein
MGIVYRALDLKLDREVALKVLPPELVADPERKRRFVQEAKSAAKLEHPHIGVVYEIDEVDEASFIAMELIRGEQLRDTIAKGPLPLRRALEIATDIAEGLSKAHNEGIVHRDLKPANIMVTEDGHTKIIDFGLAKLVEPLAGERSDVETAIRGGTDPGTVMGTVSYMSPEQAGGKKVDHRSDIFSFGVLLHEMLTGEPPFQGPTGVDTLHAILRDSAPRLTLLGPEVPDEAAYDVQHIVDKCLQKDLANRYQGMKDLAVDIRAVRHRLESGQVAPVVSPVRPKLRLLAGAVALVLAITSVILFLRLFSEKKLPTDDEGVGTPSRPSIAVLYFENASGDPELDWLRTGLTDMLVTDLSQSQNLRVLSTDRLYQILRDMNQLDERVTSLDVVQDVAELADAETVILGSFMKAGDNIRINIRIQDARSAEILTTEKVEGVGDSSIFSMVDDLNRRVMSHLDIPAAAAAETDMDVAKVTTSSVEAFRYYVEGQKLHWEGKYEEAIFLYEEAIERDPQFAMALAKLSAVYGNMARARTAEEYSRQALVYSERLPARERYFVEGVHYSRRQGTFSRSIEAYQNLLKIDPTHGPAKNNLAYRYLIFERYDEAIELLEECIRQGHFSVLTYANLANSRAFKGQFGRGVQVLQDYLAKNPDSVMGHYQLGRLLLRWDKVDEALGVFTKMERLSPGHSRSLRGRWLACILKEEWEDAETAATALEAFQNPTERLRGLRALSITELYLGRSQNSLRFSEQAALAYDEPEPAGARMHNLSARVLLERGQAADVLDHTKISKSQGKNNVPEWEGLFYEALAQASLGNWQGADTAAEKLRSTAESLPTKKEKRRYRHLLGELARMRGDTALAVEVLEQALSILPEGLSEDPTHVAIWFSLANAYLEAGDESKAAQWFRRITESGYEHIYWPIPYVRSFYFLGKIHENRGEMDKAREYYRRFYDYWTDGDMDRERVEEARKKLES